MPNPEEHEEKKGFLDKVEDFLTTPLWGADKKDEEQQAQAPATTQSETTPFANPPVQGPVYSGPQTQAAPSTPPSTSSSSASSSTSPSTSSGSSGAFQTPTSGTYTPPTAAEKAQHNLESEVKDLRKQLEEVQRQNDLERQQAAVAAAQAPAAPAQRTYTVVGGDSLSKIAKHFYGDPMQWRKIYEANRDKIKNPDLIHPGQEFIIP